MHVTNNNLPPRKLGGFNPNTMRKISIIFTILLAQVCMAQVAIGKSDIDGKAILDFGSENKGIILPIADTSDPSVTYTNGTILMDVNDLTIKAYQNNTWMPLSDAGQLNVVLDEDDNPISTEYILNLADEIGVGAVIGEVDNDGLPVSGADGVLVLESTDSALVLPKVADPHINIKSPVAGTMCYDLTSDSLAIFDGKVWNYWK